MVYTLEEGRPFVRAKEKGKITGLDKTKTGRFMGKVVMMLDLLTFRSKKRERLVASP